MELHEALPVIKPLLTDSLAVYSGMVAYDNDTLRAFDGVNSIKVSVPGLPGPWCVDGAKLTAVCKKGSKPTLSEKHLVVANGKARFQLYNHQYNRIDELVPDLPHDGEAIPISADDWDTLKRATTFRSPHAVYPWAACIYIRNHKAYVTNNIAAVVFDIGLEVEGMIPAVAVESLATASFVHIGPHCIVLTQDSLSLRCSLPEVEPPEKFFIDCDKIGEAQTPKTENLAEAFESTIMIDPKNVIIRHDGIKAASTKGDEVDVEIVTGFTKKKDDGEDDQGIFDPRYIVPALKLAEFVDWNLYPKPVLFRGPGVKGMLAGRTAA